VIILTQKNDANVNIVLSNYILQSSDPILTMEWERSAFEKVVEDVSFVLDDSDFTFSNLFKGKPVSTIFNIRIELNGSLVFLGKIFYKSIRFNPIKETCSFDVFSSLKDFWTQAKQTGVARKERANSADATTHFTTLSYILKREFIDPDNHLENGIKVGTNRYSSLFTNLSVHASLANSPIRGWALASTYVNPQIGNNGRYRNLLGTHADLLNALTIWYNAEFHIDYAASALVMNPRYLPINSTPYNGAPYELSTIARDDNEIYLQFHDDKKYSWIHTLYYYGDVVKPNLSLIRVVGGLQGFTKNVSFVTTKVYTTNTGLVESAPSPALFVDVVNVVAPYNETKSAEITLTIPAVAGVNYIYLYRTPQAGGNFHLVQVLSASGGTYTESAPNEDLITTGRVAPSLAHSYGAYMTYDENSGKWATIVDSFPGGSPFEDVLETIPIVRFQTFDNGTPLDYSVDDVVAFFGYESASNNWEKIIQGRYISELSTRQLIAATVDGSGYKLGDAFTVSTSIFPQVNRTGWWIKKVVAHLEEEQGKHAIELVNS